MSCGVLFARSSPITAQTIRIERTTDQPIVLVLDNCLQEASTRFLVSSRSLTYTRLFGQTAEVPGQTLQCESNVIYGKFISCSNFLIFINLSWFPDLILDLYEVAPRYRWSHSTTLSLLMSTRALRTSFFINQVSLVQFQYMLGSPNFIGFSKELFKGEQQVIYGNNGGFRSH